MSSVEVGNSQEEECKKFWEELFNQFNGLNKFIVGNEEPLVNYINEETGKDGCKNPSIGVNSWTAHREKLQQMILQTSTQQSGDSSVVMASTLGPAAGIGAGLSLFPLMAKFLKR